MRIRLLVHRKRLQILYCCEQLNDGVSIRPFARIALNLGEIHGLGLWRSASTDIIRKKQHNFLTEGQWKNIVGITDRELDVSLVSVEALSGQSRGVNLKELTISERKAHML